jgi:hypothetical protein
MPGPRAFPLCLAYPIHNPFVLWELVAGAAALVLIGEAVALAYTRRASKGARPQSSVAISVWGLGTWAILLTFWVWAVGTTFSSGPCADPVSSWPVPSEMAEGVAAWASVATALAAVVLSVVSSAVVRSRLRGGHSSTLS